MKKYFDDYSSYSLYKNKLDAVNTEYNYDIQYNDEIKKYWVEIVK